jgi:hypothetical protein
MGCYKSIKKQILKLKSMSRIKELKSLKETQINLIDALELVCENKQSKYIETIYRLIKNTPDLEKFAKEIKQELKTKYNSIVPADSDLTPFQLGLYYQFMESMFNAKDLETYNNFCRYNERGLIPENDLSKYHTFSQIENSVNIAELKLMEKDLQKQVKILYKSDEWLVLRPLTFLSSRKYGANTKWCTTNESPSHFLRYTKRGILIYMLNMITGVKVACFKSLDKEPEFSFWDQLDIRIDSLESGLPAFILDVIAKEVTTDKQTNFSHLSDEDRKKQEALIQEKVKMSDTVMNDEMEERQLEPEGDNEVMEEAPQNQVHNIGIPRPSGNGEMGVSQGPVSQYGTATANGN